MNGLQSQVVVITGASRGIGKAIAYKLASEGADLALIGTNLTTGDVLLEEISQAYPSIRVRFYALDVSKTESVKKTIEKILEDFGQIDILVNNAGITADQLLMKMSEDEWDRVLSVNLKSCYNTCQAVVRSMMKAKKGKIINISSVIGLVGNPGQVNYAAAKAGMIGFTKALAKEVASRKIQVNCIAPGFIQTNMTDLLSEKQKEEILKQIPLGYIADPVEIANMVWFLASSLSQYITGQVLVVDGGMVM
jgi:3-oxoacyl-[acyl-carrier protein] reductase